MIKKEVVKDGNTKGTVALSDMLRNRENHDTNDERNIIMERIKARAPKDLVMEEQEYEVLEIGESEDITGR